GTVEEPREAAALEPAPFEDREQHEPVAFADEEPVQHEPVAFEDGEPVQHEPAELEAVPEPEPPDVVSEPPFESAAAVGFAAPLEEAAHAPEPGEAAEPEPAPSHAAAYPRPPAEGPTVIPGAPAGPAEPYGVPTEARATLYQAQGFPDRAAAIYRVLVRERP